jgi:hypothetical protein
MAVGGGKAAKGGRGLGTVEFTAHCGNSVAALFSTPPGDDSCPASLGVYAAGPESPYHTPAVVSQRLVEGN